MVLGLLSRVFNFTISGISNQNFMWSNSVCTSVEFFHLSVDMWPVIQSIVEPLKRQTKTAADNIFIFHFYLSKK